MVEFLPISMDLPAIDKAEVVRALTMIGILNIKHLWVRNFVELIDFDSALSRAHGILVGIRAIMLQVMQVLQSMGTLLRTQERGVQCWGWLGKDKVIKRWELDNYHAYSIIHSKREIEQALNKRWRRSDFPVRWWKCFLRLWESNLPLNGKVVIWRILSFLFFHIKLVETNWERGWNLCLLQIAGGGCSASFCQMR